MARSESPLINRIQSSPRQRNSPVRNDSPARTPAEFDLVRRLENLDLLKTEQQKVWVYQKVTFQDGVEARQEAQALAHQSEIDEAYATHTAVREQAEAALRAHLKAEQERKRQQEDEERRRQEEEARRKAEAERRAREEEQRRIRETTEREEAAQRAEAERKRLEEERKRKDAEDAQRKDAERREQEADTARRKAAAEAEVTKRREEAAKQSIPKPAPVSTTSSAVVAPIRPDLESRHDNYLALHKRLKKFRIDFWENSKSDKAFKAMVGEMRRAVRTHVGQLRIDGTKDNREAMFKIKTTITHSLNDTHSPQVPVNDFLPTHLHLPEPSPTIPSLTIYLLSILSKAVINVCIVSCIDNAKSAEAPGVLVAQIFALPALQFPSPTNPHHPTTLITILLAKLHASAPQLFGITAPENPATTQSRTRLCWRRDAGPDGKKDWVTESTHYDRLVGLGAFYAAISLRNFSKTKSANPLPPTHYWESLALLVNTPPQQMQTGQLVLIRQMLENSSERVVQFWGATGVALLRECVVGMVGRLSKEVREGWAAKGIEIMRDRWGTEGKFHLT